MAMCRLNKVEKARKSPGNCQRCGTEIEAGQPYRWWKGRYTGKRVRCMKPSCSPKPWELETNGTKQEAMQGEDAHHNATGAEDVTTATSYLEEAKAIAESLVDQLTERIENKSGTGLEQSSEVEALQSSLDAFEDYVSSAEDVLGALSNLEDEPPSEDDFDPNDPEYANEDDPEQAALDAYELEAGIYKDGLEGALGELEEWPELDLGQYGPPRPRRKPKAQAEPA